MMEEGLVKQIHDGLWEAHCRISDSYHGAIEAKLREWVDAGFDPSELVIDEYPFTFEHDPDRTGMMTFTGRFRVRTKDDEPIPWRGVDDR